MPGLFWVAFTLSTRDTFRVGRPAQWQDSPENHSQNGSELLEIGSQEQNSRCRFQFGTISAPFWFICSIKFPLSTTRNFSPGTTLVDIFRIWLIFLLIGWSHPESPRSVGPRKRDTVAMVQWASKLHVFGVGLNHDLEARARHVCPSRASVHFCTVEKWFNCKNLARFDRCVEPVGVFAQLG